MIITGLNKAMYHGKLNRTRIHLILFSPFYPSVFTQGKRWQNPVSCEDMPAIDNIVACEGMEQRIVPTGMAVGGNEIKQHRNLSETHFPGVAPCGSRLDGHDGDTVRDGGRPSVCYPVRGQTRVK